MATKDFTDRRRIKLDKIPFDWETGKIKANPTDGTTPAVSNIMYGYGAPPDPSTVPEGTVYIKLGG